MSSSAWLNRGTLARLLLGIAVGGGATAAVFLLREKPKEQANAEQPKPETPAPRPETPAPKPSEPVEDVERIKLSKAQLGCKFLSQAGEAYMLTPANAKRSYPAQLDDLIMPPFGGPGYLRKPKEDIITPWGQPYRLLTFTRFEGGSPELLVFTFSPDGVMVSQHGIGKYALQVF
jgi:hypothetical protein